MENVLISACLLGVSCRYDGEGKDYGLESLKEKYNLVPFCPEIYGGLPTPRVPSEITGDRVVNRDGLDVTKEYNKGAEEALRICRLFGIKKAILKARSPSCGNREIYDGSFSGKLCEGMGITARLLVANGIEVLNENELELP